MQGTYIEVNLKKIKKNICLIKEEVHNKPMIMGIVKGNAYGHGLVEVSKSIENDVDYFGVGFLEEGIELRTAGIKKPILLLSPFFDKRILDYNIIPTVDSIKTLYQLYRMAVDNHTNINFHLKIDTGMNRFGLKEEVKEFFEFYEKQDKVKMIGVYSHFATTMRNRKKVLYQWNRFVNVIEFIKSRGIENCIFHIANSEIALDFPEARLDMIRVGNALYGKCNSIKNIGLQQVGRLKTPIVAVRSIKKGEYIGYSFSYKAKRNMTIGIIPIGTKHGFTLKRTPNSIKDIFLDFLRTVYKYMKAKEVYFGNIPLRIVGKVGMQFSAVDITDYPNIKEGSFLEIKTPILFINENIKIRYYEGED